MTYQPTDLRFLEEIHNYLKTQKGRRTIRRLIVDAFQYDRALLGKLADEGYTVPTGYISPEIAPAADRAHSLLEYAKSPSAPGYSVGRGTVTLVYALVQVMTEPSLLAQLPGGTRG